jgi:DNA gyrase subunit A
MGRYAQGVRLIKLDDDEVAAVAKVNTDDDDGELEAASVPTEE